MKPSYEQLERWAFEDELTGLSNRRKLALVLDERMALVVPSFFVAIDLNGFKRAQDEHPEGHAYGDRVLKAFADFLTRTTRRDLNRPKDVAVYRQGGDEFLVVVDSLEGAKSVGARVLAWSFDKITASIGIGPSINYADARLFDAKLVRDLASSTPVK